MTKNKTKIAEYQFTQEIKDRQRQIQAVLKSGKVERSRLAQMKDTAINTSVSERNNALKKIKKTMEPKKVQASEIYQTLRDEAYAQYEADIKAAKDRRDETISKAKGEKEKVLRQLQKNSNKQTVPLYEKHKKNVDKIEANFMKKVGTVQAKENSQISDLNDEIENLQEQIAILEEAGNKTATEGKESEEQVAAPA